MSLLFCESDSHILAQTHLQSLTRARNAGFATSGVHPELDDVNSGPHAASIKHDAVLGPGGGDPGDPGPLLRGRNKGLGSGGSAVAFHQHQVGEQGAHKEEEPGQLRSPHGGGRGLLPVHPEILWRQLRVKNKTEKAPRIMARESLDSSERQSVKASVAPTDTENRHSYLSWNPEQLVGPRTWRATPTPAHLRNRSPSSAPGEAVSMATGQ